MGQQMACNGGCDTCDKCVACQKCNACQCDCEKVQLVEGGECGTLVQVLPGKRNFQFSVRPTKNVGIMGPNSGQFNKSVWQEVIDFYNKGVVVGKRRKFFESKLADASGGLAPFTAAEFNRVSSQCDGPTVSKGQLILGSYFTSLENAVSNKKGAPDACDKCNEKCDCDGADSTRCNACQNCNTGVTDATGSHPTCCGCNSSCESEQKPVCQTKVTTT